MNIQPLLNIAELCYKKGIKHAVISPGSRSAPITLGFANHPNIECKIINDERSAGFIALGISLSLNEPIVLICTSGTAALNYAPAIAEAYYQQIPLLVLTADRPPELIDQQDGQCLRQYEIYKNYVKKSYQTPDKLDTDENEHKLYQIIDDAINTCNSVPLGSAHINIPIREPFYPEGNIEFKINNYVYRNIESHQKPFDFNQLINKVNSTDKVLFIAGQQRTNSLLTHLIQRLIKAKYPVITDINSNLCNVDGAIQTEEYVFQNDIQKLHPKLLVTFGNSILSKKIKLYFRKNKTEHWHIAPTEPTPDFFFQLKGSFNCNPIDFFSKLIDEIETGNSSYFESCKKINSNFSLKTTQTLNASEWSEPYILHTILSELPENSHLHLSNSMTVRWVNMIGIEAAKNFTIQSNRGVSGIDGCTSTALGYALHSENQNFLFTGDIAFFYDRNAFWNDYIPNNLKIILLNNHEGGIFNLISGPGNNKDTLKYFISSQNLNAKLLSEEFNLEYFYADNKNNLNKQLKKFIKSEKCSILELESNSEINSKVLKSLY